MIFSESLGPREPWMGHLLLRLIMKAPSQPILNTNNLIIQCSNQHIKDLQIAYHNNAIH